MTALPEAALPFCALPGLIGEQAGSRPLAAALHEGQRSLSYGQLDVLMDRVAAALQRDGMGPGQQIAICGASSIEYVVVFMGGLARRSGRGAAGAGVNSAAAGSNGA